MTKKKKYILGLEETSKNVINHTSIIEHNENPNIMLTSIDVYQSNYDYTEISSDGDRAELYKFEVTIVDNLKHLTRNFKEVCQKLFNAQQLLANHDKSNGMFYKWFESMSLDKNFVYRCIERYKLYLDSQKDVYLSQDIPIRTIQLLKSVDTEVKMEIADLLSRKEITSTSGVQNYLVSHVRQDTNSTSKPEVEKIKKKHLQITRSTKEVVVKITSYLSDANFEKLKLFLDDLVDRN